MMADASDIRAMSGLRVRQPLCAALACAGLAACSGTGGDPEQRLRAWIDHGHEAAERKDRGELVDMISPAYADARGNTRKDIDGLLRFFFLRTGDVALLVSVDDIDIIGDTAAEVMLTVGMGATTDGIPGFDADAMRFGLELEKDREDWLLVSGRWSDLGGELR